MKKLLMLAAVLLGTAGASQAGIDVHVGIPFPRLPRVIIEHPRPIVVERGYYHYPPPVVVAPPYCAPVYAYPYPRGHGHGHGHYRHYRHHGHGHHDYGHGRDHSRGGHHGHHGHR